MGAGVIEASAGARTTGPNAVDTLPPVQPGVERIEDPDRVNQVRDDLIAGARRTVQVTLPAGPYPRALLEAQWDVGVAVLGRDVRISGVYQADAAREPDALTLLTAFARRGADLRIALSVSHRTVVVDRSCVIVATDEGMGWHPALLVTEPALVAGFCARFDALRAAAVPVGAIGMTHSRPPGSGRSSGCCGPAPATRWRRAPSGSPSGRSDDGSPR